MSWIKFQEVAVKGTRRFKDPETGRWRQQTQKFWQTVNPYNLNASGQMKTAGEILDEVRAQRDAWLSADPSKGA